MRKQMTCVVGLAFLLLGCRTLDNSTFIALAGTIAGSAAKYGTIYELTQKPVERPLFEAAAMALDKLIADEAWDAAKFKEVLGKLPAGVFKGEQGAIYLDGAVVVFDVLTSTLFDINSSVALKSVMVKVRDGIDAGLAATGARKGVRGLALPAYDIVPLTRRVL